MKARLHFVASLLIGCIVAIAIARTGVVLARALWPAYAAAEPHKDYTLAMLASRLAVGAVSTAGAAWVATIIARDNGRAAWWLGGLFLALSLPDHLYLVWNDYPVWYHFVFLAYLVPVAGLTGRAVGPSLHLWRPISRMASRAPTR
jgi:hypothetical protein